MRTSTPVTRVLRGRAAGEPVTVYTATGPAAAGEQFDAVVFATHSDITLRLLGEDADAPEREVLGAVPYNDNDVWLHTGGWLGGRGGVLRGARSARAAGGQGSR